MSRRLLKVASQQRQNISGTSPSNFVMPVQGMRTLAGRWRLLECHITNSVWTVDTRNNTIYFFENSVNKTATIASGFYTPTTFLTAIGTAMTTASGGYNTYTATQDTAKQTVTVTASTNPFQLMFGTNTTNTAAYLMGFINVDTASATSQTGTGIMNLNQTQSFNIDIVGTTSGVADAKSNSYTLCIPNSVNSQEVVHYYPTPETVQIVEFQEGVNQIKATVRDDNQNLLGLNNADWWALLQPLD